MLKDESQAGDLSNDFRDPRNNGPARKFHQTDELRFAAAKVGKEVSLMV